MPTLLHGPGCNTEFIEDNAASTTVVDNQFYVCNVVAKTVLNTIDTSVRGGLNVALSFNKTVSAMRRCAVFCRTH